jgi:HEAT repeat protein
MPFPRRRVLQIKLLRLASCALLMLIGCDKLAPRQSSGQETENKGGGRELVQQDKGAPEEARKSTDKKDSPVKQPAPDKPDEEVGGISYQGKPLADWIAQLQDKDAGTRVKAAQALGHMRRFDAVPPQAVLLALAKALKDKDETVRFVASESLKGWGEQSVPVLVEALKDEDVKVRRIAASTLGERELHYRSAESAMSAVSALGDALRSDKDTEVRTEGAGALGRLGKPSESRSAEVTRSAVSALSDALLKDRDADVRRAAAYALGQIGEPGVPALLTAMKSKDADSRSMIISVLHHGLQDVDPRRKVVPAVAEYLKDEDAGVRRDAAMFLGDAWNAGGGAALPDLLRASKAEDKGGEAAREALQKIHKAPRSAAPELLTLLKDPEPRIRLKAAEVLCDLEEGDKECLAVLVELVKRRDPQIREDAARLLYRYGWAAKDAVPALIEIVRNDPQARPAAIGALGAIGPEAKAAIPALKAAGQEDKRVEGFVKEALRKIEQ